MGPEETPGLTYVCEWRTCGCTVWPMPLRMYGFGEGTCNRCGEKVDKDVGDLTLSRTAAYEVARRTGLLDPDAPVHPVEQGGTHA